MERYYASLEIKKDVFVSAKNKSDARKKIKKKLNEQKAKNYVKIDFVEESYY